VRSKPFSISFDFVTFGGLRAARRGLCALWLLALTLSTGCRAMLPRQYEYDEEIVLALDGSATMNVSGSVPALVALHGVPLDIDPRARFDRTAVREFYASDVFTLRRISTSRRDGRRFVHLTFDVPNIAKLPQARPLAHSTFALRRQGNQYIYKEIVGATEVHPVGDVGWTGHELVAFRMHLPARIRYHDAPSHEVERGNILIWEQTLTDRLKGTPVRMEVRMDTESILYSTLWLFGVMALAVIVLFAAIIWLVIRKGRQQAREQAG
jgi:hypothetical protein